MGPAGWAGGHQVKPAPRSDGFAPSLVSGLGNGRWFSGSEFAQKQERTVIVTWAFHETLKLMGHDPI